MIDDINEDFEVEDDFQSADIDREILTQTVVKDRIYSNYLSHSEFVSVVGRRADDIEAGASEYIITNEHDARSIAMLEIMAGKSPMALEKSRGIRGNEEFIEIWEVNEMILTKECISTIRDFINLNNINFNLKTEIEELLSKK